MTPTTHSPDDVDPTTVSIDERNDLLRQEDEMGEDQLAVLGGLGLERPSVPRLSTPVDEAVPHHPLSILAFATSVRLDDPLREHERVVMVEVVNVAGREAAQFCVRPRNGSLR